MLASLKAPGITKIKAKKSRNHTELLFKTLDLPIKIIQKKNYDYFLFIDSDIFIYPGVIEKGINFIETKNLKM